MLAQVLIKLGDHPLLERSDARLLYVLQNCGSGGAGFGAGVRVSLRSDASPEAPGADRESDSEVGSHQEQVDAVSGLYGSPEGITKTICLSPEHERGACRWVLHLCEEERRTVEALAEEGARGDVPGAEALSVVQEWMHRRHVLLASTYCGVRLALLLNVMQDLEAQLHLVGA